MTFVTLFTLNIDFTISSWIRPDVFGSDDQVLFSKDNSESALKVVFSWFIKSTGKLAAHHTTPGSLGITEETEGSTTVDALDWSFVACSI